MKPDTVQVNDLGKLTAALEPAAWMTPGGSSCITKAQKAQLLAMDAERGPDQGFGAYLISKHTVALYTGRLA